MGIEKANNEPKQIVPRDLFGNPIQKRQMSLSSKNGYNDYFLFNDLRNGHTTIHSWDIADTTERQKEICLLLLRNRRKSQFGLLDGNPLSLEQFRQLDSSITQKDLNDLVDIEILKKVDYRFEILEFNEEELSESEQFLLNLTSDNQIVIDSLKTERSFKVNRISISDTINSLLKKKAITCIQERYDFKNTKISSGLNGVNRVFMPTSDVFPTLVASDTNDYVSLKSIEPTSHDQYRTEFLEEIYQKGNYRKITKEEACLIQGFPKHFKLPDSRARWMKLIGNSVSVPVIEVLIEAITDTGIFDSEENTIEVKESTKCQYLAD